jgi:folate-binding protein YgfZ
MNHDAEFLSFLNVVRFRGPDAVSFLQGQLTNDVAALGDGRTQLAACTTQQGRVATLMWLRQQDADVYALVPAELADSVITRLRRYVLRSKVEITRLADAAVAWTNGSGRSAGEPDPATGVRPVRFQLPDGRLLAVGAAGAREDPNVAARWSAADIVAGLPQITTATSEHFVPQMLNLDRLDAISFTKGCYTGQEIVARTQHLGRIKRRCFRYSAAAESPLEPLSPLNRDGTKVGEVVISARAGNAVELLAVVALEARDLPLRTATGHTAIPLPLPYSV